MDFRIAASRQFLAVCGLTIGNQPFVDENQFRIPTPIEEAGKVAISGTIRTRSKWSGLQRQTAYNLVKNADTWGISKKYNGKTISSFEPAVIASSANPTLATNSLTLLRQALTIRWLRPTFVCERGAPNCMQNGILKTIAYTMTDSTAFALIQRC